jgi:hypothetical protein
MRLDEHKAAQDLLRFHERTVGGRYLAIADPDGYGFVWECQCFGGHHLAASPELGIMGSDRTQDGLCFQIFRIRLRLAGLGLPGRCLAPPPARGRRQAACPHCDRTEARVSHGGECESPGR